jgi:sugar phosphate isomerase/epimerase
MQVQRFLASAWATVHGPSEPRALLVSLLENGFAGLGVSPGPRAVDWSAVTAAAADLPVRFAAVRAAGPLLERASLSGFASDSDGERQVARRAIGDAVQTARLLGVPQVVLDVGVVPVVGEIEAEDLGDPAYGWTEERAQALCARRKVGRDAAVDRTCRGLFDVLKSFPDMSFSLTQGRSLRSVLDVRAMQDVCEDLGHRGVGYWHDAAICARREQVLGEPQGEWLEVFGNRLCGMTLGDASPEGLYLPPGAGGVDYGLCATYVPRTGAAFPVVLELDPSVPPGEMAGMRSCLDKYGF